MLKSVFGYIRVSTVKQGQTGVSLHEQRDSILRYAARNNLELVSWFEEQETAAKQGRPVFNELLKLLKGGKAKGVVLHKIDRGARNLKDWAILADLSDIGIEVHFANESLDLHSRGGRLSADIQAVVAADFIRNLREETRKGFYGRLKQGLYPLGAPVGYLDRGRGNPKVPDPAKAPLIKKAFELYSTGQHNLCTLRSKLDGLGLRNKKGGPVSLNGLSRILNNTFYIGLIHLRSTGQTFAGNHEPLISKALFDRVQSILTGKWNSRIQKHDFLFRRMIRCKSCGHSMIGERQKGHHYYRCHTPSCETTGIREETIEESILRRIATITFTDEELSYFRVRLEELKDSQAVDHQKAKEALNLRLAQNKDRQNRLTDAFIDAAIDKEVFEQRKAALLLERRGLQDSLTNFDEVLRDLPKRLLQNLELAANAWLSYKIGNPDEKRELIKNLTSNLWVQQKNVLVELQFPFSEIAKRSLVTTGDPNRGIPRTWECIRAILLKKDRPK